MGMPTVLDVGRVAGVSRQTVSNVLNAPDLVKAATRERVEAAIAQLGYRPHASARRLRTRRSGTLAIRLDPMTNGISGSVHDRFLHSLTEQADRRGLRVMLFTAQDRDDELGHIRRLHEGADVDAFVLTSTVAGDTRSDWLIENRVPFVAFGRPWDSGPDHLWVDVDGRSGLRLATERLIANGERRIVFLGWPSPSGTGDDRRLGWHDAMTAGTDLRPAELDDLSLGVEDGVAQGREAVRGLRDAGIPFDAVVCASDSLALGALLMVGPDIPVIGYDNTPVAEAIGLSSIEQPLDEVAAGVLRLLMGDAGPHLIDHDTTPNLPRHILVEPRLIERHRRLT
jgi:DNA-binding LacI/PurR family transcriptional regulator